MRSQSLKLLWPHLHILVHVPKYLPGKVIATNGVALSEGVVNTQCATQYPTIARQCQSVVRATTQVNGETQTLTPATPKRCKLQSKKLAEVMTSWTPTPVQKFVTISSGVSFPRMRYFAHQKLLVSLFLFFVFCFFGFLQLATVKAPGQILIQNTPPKHAVPRKDVPFRGREHKI